MTAMRFLVVAVVVTAALAFFYKNEFRHALDELTDVQTIKVAEGEALANAEGRESPAKPAPAAEVRNKDKEAPVAEKKPTPAKAPAIQPVGTSKGYALPSADRERK
jgi:hypothetical protein